MSVSGLIRTAMCNKLGTGLRKGVNVAGGCIVKAEVEAEAEEIYHRQKGRYEDAMSVSVLVRIAMCNKV